MDIRFAERFDGITGSEIRKIFALLNDPEMISLAGGNPSPQSFPAKEVAEILRISVKTTYKLINENAIPSIKVGREKRIAKTHLIEYLQNKDKTTSNPEVYFIEETSDNVWTLEKTCDSVRVAKIIKGGYK